MPTKECCNLLRLLLMLCCTLGSVAKVQGADIVNDVRTGEVASGYNESYIEVGVSLVAANDPLEVKFNEDYADHQLNLDFDVYGQFRMNNYFLEGTQGTMDGLNLGYSVWSNASWQVDFLAGSLKGLYDFGKDYDIEAGDSETERNRKIYERNRLYAGTGLRVTHYRGKYVLQFRLVDDLITQSGVTSSLRLGRGWQYRNWYFFGIFGAEFSSAQTNQMWYGISESEATERYPAYSPPSSWNFSSQMGFIRPLSEHWVLRGYMGYSNTPASAARSALVDDHDTSYTTISVLRVF